MIDTGHECGCFICRFRRGEITLTQYRSEILRQMSGNPDPRSRDELQEMWDETFETDFENEFKKE